MAGFIRFSLLLLLVGYSKSFFWGENVEDDDYDNTSDPNEYGVDFSFPQHHYNGIRQTKSVNPMKAYFAKRYEKHIRS